MPAPLKPSLLRPGDRIGLIAPASPPLDVAQLDRGTAYLTSLGYEVVTFRPAYPSHGYLAGTDAERIDELNEALRHPDVHTIFCVRGGYGTLRLLPHIDYAAVRAHPKLIVGYSDITALHLALYEKAGVRGLSGSMVAVDWARPHAESEALFWKTLTAQDAFQIAGPGEATLQPIRAGDAEGVLLGGNLSLITRLIGTPYLPSLDGVLLFIEEVAEAPYRIDGMLAHLKLAGLLDRLGGLIIGGLTGWEPDSDRPTLSYDDVLHDYLHDAPFPVVKGLAYGHFSEKHAMPVGVRARLHVTSTTATLTVLESLTA